MIKSIQIDLIIFSSFLDLHRIELTIMKDLDFNNKKVLLRVDFNVPLNSNFEVTDDTRIKGALPTIKEILTNGGKLIVMSHLGRPQKKLTESGEIDRERFTLQHVVPRLSELLNLQIEFVEDTIGEKVQKAVEELGKGELLLLENTRFYPEEKKGDPEFAKQLAALADIYVNDAFGSAHRAHASTTTVAEYFDQDHKTFGFLMNQEIENANKVLHHAESPFVAIVGGAKVSDKITLLEQLIPKVDEIIVGGGMAYTFIKAQGGQIGQSLVELDKLELANKILTLAKENNTNIHLPVDSKIAEEFKNDANSDYTKSNEIPDGWMGLDIGLIAQSEFSGVIAKAKTILWNGPMGVFEMENFASGTKAIAQAVADATQSGAFSLVGGGDSVAAINLMNLADQISYVSTGGGAMLEYLEGKELPGIAAMNQNIS